MKANHRKALREYLAEHAEGAVNKYASEAHISKSLAETAVIRDLEQLLVQMKGERLGFFARFKARIF